MSSCKRLVQIVEVVLFLFIMLVTTRALGEGTERIGLPASVGEVLAGVMLAVLISRLGGLAPGLAAVVDGPEIKLLATIGIFALMLLAGIEMRPNEIAANSRGAFFVALGGMIVPLLAGVALAWVFIPDSPLKSVQALFVGVALSTTAVPAATRLLMELGLFHTRLGQVIIAAAIFDDVFGLVLLAVLIGVIGSGEVPDALALGILLLKVVGLSAPFAKQPQQHDHQVDEVEIERQRAHDGLLGRDFAAVRLEVHVADFLGVVGRQADKDEHADHGDGEIQRRGGKEYIHDAGDDDADQAHDQERTDR